MKQFKKTDLYISILLIIASIIYSLIVFNFDFIYTYFIVGGWQVISMVVHQVNKWHTEKGTKRFIYHRIVIVTGLVSLLSYFTRDFFIYVLLFLLFASPLMAIYYTWICYREISLPEYNRSKPDKHVL